MKKLIWSLCFCGLSLFSSGQILIDKKINDLKGFVMLDSTVNLLVEPGQISKVTIGIKDSIYFEILLSKDELVKFISTADAAFSTTEKIKIGTQFGYLLRKCHLKKTALIHYPGWGNAIRLRSGWFAVFDVNEPVRNNARVLFFYQKSESGISSAL